MIEIGRYTYGYDNMSIYGQQGSSLQIGSFCSVGDKLSVFLGGNHRVDQTTTFPFGHIFQDELGGAEIVGHPQSNGDVIISVADNGSGVAEENIDKVFEPKFTTKTSGMGLGLAMVKNIVETYKGNISFV